MISLSEAYTHSPSLTFSEFIWHNRGIMSPGTQAICAGAPTTPFAAVWILYVRAQAERDNPPRPRRPPRVPHLAAWSVCDRRPSRKRRLSKGEPARGNFKGMRHSNMVLLLFNFPHALLCLGGYQKTGDSLHHESQKLFLKEN